MESGRLPLVVGLISASARDVALRAVQITDAARIRLAGGPATAVVTAVLTAWLVNTVDWGHGNTRLLVAVCSGSLVATVVLAAGWVAEPDKLEKWGLRALAAAVGSALPFLASGG